MKRPFVIVLMGVSGSGKSTIGNMLATQLGTPFYDGDDFHPAANVTKMQADIALEDADRLPWLERLHALAIDLLAGTGGVIACSALKAAYRDILMQGIAHRIKWIFLEGEYDLIRTRMLARSDHYMPADLLASQFQTLEIPAYAIRVSVQLTPDQIVRTIMHEIMAAEIGIVGLGVMGRALAHNFAAKGYSLALYNRHVPGKEERVAANFVATQKLSAAQAFDALPAFVAALQRPRKIILMIDAGLAVDEVIAQLSSLVAPGDVIADCGNSHYHDTQRRYEMLAAQGIHFLGTGVSGGEKGARQGPAIMPGGSVQGYEILKPALEHIAARDRDQLPCCNYIGGGGAGHFVKMVHNGIEYAEMQLIVETYGILRHAYGYTPDAIAALFESWNAGIQKSFLLEITTVILRRREGEGWLIDQIADAARSKGTGGWTLEAANTLGVPSPVIAAAVHARFLSAQIESRTQTDALYPSPKKPAALHMEMQLLHDALYLSRLINHHLGFILVQRASDVYQWHLDLREIARIWTNGCIIRSALMQHLRDVLPGMILHTPSVVTTVQHMRNSLTEVCTMGMQAHVAMPCHAAALSFLDGLTMQYPVANIVQAQRDAFGAHGYVRSDDDSGDTHHTEWGV